MNKSKEENFFKENIICISITYKKEIQIDQ